MSWIDPNGAYIRHYADDQERISRMSTRTQDPYEAKNNPETPSPQYVGAPSWRGPRIEMDAAAARDASAASPHRRDVEEVAFLESRHGGLECSYCHGVEETQLAKTMVRLAKDAIPNFERRRWGVSEVQREPEEAISNGDI